ncbi:dienelactone hydrolase family protein [Actinocatenispora thailandica]|uniref:dienelactone hydrolase family protein n=1 Tax=Actinocatenispora thailandica TaxID=227318 RepID=UPI003B832759
MAAAPRPAADAGDIRVSIPAGPVTLPGLLAVPGGAGGIVVFAHGSGSSRLSPRNQYVARLLNRAGFATLLFDLLTPDESIDRRNVFDIDLLARRLAAAIGWIRHQPAVAGRPVGLFGASTGAAAALAAAADPALDVGAVVSRGGRPDLADRWLPAIGTPTLLIVGGADPVVLTLNREALDRLAGPKHLAVVPGATHLFEEPGTLDQAAALATSWFAEHLAAARAGHAGVADRGARGRR